MLNSFNSKKIYLITGSTASGKSTLLRNFYNKIENKKHNVDYFNSIKFNNTIFNRYKNIVFIDNCLDDGLGIIYFKETISNLLRDCDYIFCTVSIRYKLGVFIDHFKDNIIKILYADRNRSMCFSTIKNSGYFELLYKSVINFEYYNFNIEPKSINKLTDDILAEITINLEEIDFL